MTKVEKLITGLRIIAPKIQRADFAHSSGMAMFHTAPLSEEEQLKLRELGWSAGENRSAIEDAGPWQ